MYDRAGYNPVLGRPPRWCEARRAAAPQARVLGVSVATVNRRLSRGLQLLAAELGDLYPDDEDPGES
jgi:hypothetical protein